MKIVEKTVQSDANSETDSPGIGVIKTQEAGAAVNRDNTINIELYNPGCLPKDTLVHEKSSQVGEGMAGMLVTQEMARRHLNLLGRARDKMDERHRSDTDTLERLLEVEKPSLPGP